MTFWFPASFPGASFVLTYGAGPVAFVVALLGMWASRRVEPGWAGAAAGALLAGWVLVAWSVAPGLAGWWAPRGLVEHLVGAAGFGVAATGAAAWLRGRVRGWGLAVLLGAAAWWLAGAASVRGDYWRVWFAVVGVAWAMRLSGAAGARGSVATGLVLVSGGVAAGVGPVWIGVAGVMLGSGLGVAMVRPSAVLSGVGPAVGVVALGLGTGGLARGRVGVMDLVCGLAVVAPWGCGVVERRLERGLGRRLGRRLGQFARLGSLVLVTVGAVGSAFGGAWLLRR